MATYVLTQGKAVLPQGTFPADILIEDGKITEIKENLSFKKNVKVINARGKYILPGLIDVHVHFRTPGMTQKEDWTSGSKAALAGGVTTVFDMPNTDPPTVDRESLELKRSLVQKDALINYGFFAGATKHNLEDLKKMKGITGIKVYMASSTGSLLVDDLKSLESLMRTFGNFDPKKPGSFAEHPILALHAENEECIHKKYSEHQGDIDPAVHSKIRAPECAVQAVKAALEMVKKYRARVHICHASTKGEMDLIRDFKKNQPTEIAQLISCEVTPHHLFLNDKDYERYGNMVKVNPPLRSFDDVEALWQAIADGTVDMVATDHAPHLMEEKLLPYSKSPSGVPGVQTMLPLLLNAVHKKKLTLERIVELCSYHPAQRFGLKGKGSIAVGHDADLALVDLDLYERVCHKFLWTKPDWSPFHGWWLYGWPIMTFVNGNLMYEWRDKFGKNIGKEVEWSTSV